MAVLDEHDFPPDEVPRQVITAQCMLAVEAIDGDLLSSVREAAVNAQTTETSNNIVRLAGQAVAAGYTGTTNAPTDIATWGPLVSNGISVTNGTNVITFRLQ